MIVGTFSKILNQTEIGQTGAHGQSPQFSVEMIDSVNYIFGNNTKINIDIEQQFYDKRDNSIFKFRFIQRPANKILVLVGEIGQYISKYRISSGDELILSIVNDNGRIKRYVDFIKNKDIVLFQKMNNYFKIINKDRLNQINDWNVLSEGGETNVKINNIRKVPPRSDSKTEVYCCDLFFNGSNKINSTHNNSIYILDLVNKIIKIYSWKFNKIEMP